MLEASLVNDHDFISHFDRFVLVVGDENGRNANPLDQLPQPGTELLADFRVDCRKRLVKQEQLRLGCQSAGKSDPLPLPAGQLMRITALKALEPGQLDKLHHPAPHLRFRCFFNLQAKGNIIKNGHMLK